MKHLPLVIASALALCLGVSARAQAPTDNYDVNTNDSSRNQAKQIVRSFFESYTPSTFNIEHTAGRSNMKYALGRLKAGGEVFEVTIFVSIKDQSYKIQQLKIAKSD